ncbi:MAG: hypothetical protein QF733_09000 [Phycisphaerales bacterium]|nr:hypothetical protein [Phycisphaerales bacterium]
MGALETARTLDQSGSTTAASVIAEGCAYTRPDTVITGRDAILASYRSADEWGQSSLDQVVFESSVRPHEDGRFAIEYLDLLTRRGHQHEHRCRQIVTVQAGLITHMEHVDLPGQPEALRACFEQVGVQR